MDAGRSVDQDYLLSQQYRDSSNLTARISLHDRFSANKYGWHRWLFDHLQLPGECRMLELGGGSGTLWTNNLARISPGWKITLSDFSPGMVEAAREALAPTGLDFSYQVIDAQEIPFPNETFDAVLALHMLFHVPDLDKALREMRRVLKRGGKFFASTIGQNHLREMDELVAAFDPELKFTLDTTGFNLTNGAEILRRWFSEVKLHDYPDKLIITKAEPLLAFIMSTVKIGPELIPEKVAQLKVFIEQRLAAGPIEITKESGLFEATAG